MVDFQSTAINQLGDLGTKGARWDSNPLHAEPQSAAYPLRLLAQYRSRESNPNQEIRSLLSYPLDHTGIVRVTGLEPATHGLKVHYLTTWLHTHMAGDDRIELSTYDSESYMLPLTSVPNK